MTMQYLSRNLAVLFLLAGLVAGCASGPKGAPQLTGDQRVAVVQAVDQVKPTIVRIKVVEPSYYEGRESRFVGFGSGTIISPEGHILTNHHVAGKAVQLVVTMPNREELPARLIGTDAATDIAVIQLMTEEETEFPYTKFGDSDAAKTGDVVLALGSPGALSQSVTLGIISNTAIIPPETWGSSQFELDGEVVGRLVRWIGHDAAIYPGNSGGPLVNLDGEIIGVNEIGIGLGGAIPGNLAKDVADAIIRKGYVRRAYVGLNLQPRLDSSPLETGVLIGSVYDESPAAQAGLQPGDIILSINGEAVEGQFGEELPAINNKIAHLPIGQQSAFRIYRDGEEMDVMVDPEERQPALVPEEEMREWGITAKDVTLWKQLDLARRAEGGVIVTSTRPGGPAAQAKPEIKRNDIITEVNGKPIKTLGELVAFTEGVTTGKEELVPVLVSFERDAENFLTVVKVGIEELPTPGREVTKAWLPMETQPLTRDVAENLGKPDLMGVRVTRLYEDRPEDFPFEVGDIITGVDGEPLDVSKIEDSEVFRTLIRMYPRGAEVEFQVLRGGNEEELATQLLDAPKRAREMERYRNLDFDFVVREATYNDKTKPTLQKVEFSVIADSVTSGGWADLAGLRVGDAILSINDRKIESLDAVEAEMEKAAREKAKQVVFLIRRGAQTSFLEMEPSW